MERTSTGSQVKRVCGSNFLAFFGDPMVKSFLLLGEEARSA
jgi:hypothetical protein